MKKLEWAPVMLCFPKNNGCNVAPPTLVKRFWEAPLLFRATGMHESRMDLFNPFKVRAKSGSHCHSGDFYSSSSTGEKSDTNI